MRVDIPATVLEPVYYNPAVNRRQFGGGGAVDSYGSPLAPVAAPVVADYADYSYASATGESSGRYAFKYNDEAAQAAASPRPGTARHSGRW